MPAHPAPRPGMPTHAEIAAAGGARHMVHQLIHNRLLHDDVVVEDAAIDQVLGSAGWSHVRALQFHYVLHMGAGLAFFLAFRNPKLDEDDTHAVYKRVNEAPLSTFITANDNYVAYTPPESNPPYRRAVERGEELRAELQRGGNGLRRAVYIGIAWGDDSAPVTRFREDRDQAIADVAHERAGHPPVQGGGMHMELLRQMQREGRLTSTSHQIAVLASFHVPPAGTGVLQQQHGWNMERIFEALAPRPTLNSRPGGSKHGRNMVSRAHGHGLPAPADRARYDEIFPPGGPSSLQAISDGHTLRPYTERLADPVEGLQIRAAIAAFRMPRLREISDDYESRNHATASMARWPTVAEAAAGAMLPPAPGLPLLPPRTGAMHAQPVQRASPAAESSYAPASSGSSSGASGGPSGGASSGASAVQPTGSSSGISVVDLRSSSPDESPSPQSSPPQGLLLDGRVRQLQPAMIAAVKKSAPLVRKAPAAAAPQASRIPASWHKPSEPAASRESQPSALRIPASWRNDDEPVSKHRKL